MSVEALLARYGLPAIFLGAGFEGETATVAGGVVARAGLVSLPGACVAAAIGSFVADQLFFIAGRYYRDARLVRRLRDAPPFARALALLERHPIGFIFAFRFIYGFRTVSPFAIGTSRVAGRTFLVVNALAAATWGTAFILVGWFCGRAFEALAGRLRPDGRTLALAAVVAFVLLVIALAMRRFRRPAR
jgi:membrane protein DedA with SNARE-associated domain